MEQPRETRPEPRLRWPECFYRPEAEKLIRAPELRGLPFSRCRQLVRDAASAASRTTRLRGLSIAGLTGLVGAYCLSTGSVGWLFAPEWRKQVRLWGLACLVLSILVLVYRRYRLRAFVRKHLQQSCYLDGIIPAQCFRCGTTLEGFTGTQCPRCRTALRREEAGRTAGGT